jgi:MarR family transcriptional regulator, transcriptional regulator for hemolysin
MEDRLKNLGFLLREVSRRYALQFEVRARELSLNLPQAKALVRLEKNEGVSQTRLAELAEVDAMTMVRILDRMEADGLLERRPDPADRRARCVYLTPRAKPVLAEIWRLSEVMRAEVFEGIGEAERDVFMSVLEDIYAKLTAEESDSEAKDGEGLAQAGSRY